MSQFPIPDWAAEVQPHAFTDPALLNNRIARFERTIKRRNFFEYAAGALCVVLFSAMSVFGFVEGQIVFAGSGIVCVLCVLFVVWQLHKRGSYQRAFPEQSCLDHLRSQYQRQYDALRGVPAWYLGPLAVANFGFYIAITIQFAMIGGWAKALEGAWQPVLITAAFYGFVWWINWFAAAKLKEKIEKIDAL